jgi:acyl carrier protein
MNNHEGILDRVRNHVGGQDSDIAGKTFIEIGIDSMSLAEIIVDMEEDFDIEIDIDNFSDNTTIGEFAQSVLKLINKNITKKAS